MTAEEFEQLFGQRPIQDDLERVNCPIVGGLGHFQCGVCPIHEKPRFMCGCVVRSASLTSKEPAVQNIPLRTEIGKAVRKSFENPVLVEGDFADLEYRALGMTAPKKETE